MRLAVLGTALGAIVESDLAERQIPNRFVVPAAAACAAASIMSGIDVSALATGSALVSALLALSLRRPEALGVGDVKLSLLLVLGLDGRGTTAVLVAFALAALSVLCSSSAAAALLVRERCRLHPLSPPPR